MCHYVGIERLTLASSVNFFFVLLVLHCVVFVFVFWNFNYYNTTSKIRPVCDGLLPGWGSTWFLGKLYCLTTSVRTNGRHACIDKPVFGGRFMTVVWLSLHLFHVLDVLVHQWDKSPMFCEGVGVSETFILDQLYEGEGHFSTMVREQCTTPIDVECLWGELENLNLRLS